MMTLEQVRHALQDRKLPAVAQATGLAYETVWRISRGAFTSPSYDVVRRLSDYLSAPLTAPATAPAPDKATK